MPLSSTGPPRPDICSTRSPAPEVPSDVAEAGRARGLHNVPLVELQ